MVPKNFFITLGQYTYETQNCKKKKKKHRSHKNGFFKEGMYLFYHQRNMLRYVPYFTLESYNFFKAKIQMVEKKPHRIQSSDKAVVVAVSTHQGST